MHIFLSACSPRPSLFADHIRRATTTVYLIYVLAGRHCMQRKKLVVAIKTGQWLHLELGKSAPAFGEYDSEEAFPAL